jgi:hypothetical protein
MRSSVTMPERSSGGGPEWLSRTRERCGLLLGVAVAVLGHEVGVPLWAVIVGGLSYTALVFCFGNRELPSLSGVELALPANLGAFAWASEVASVRGHSLCEVLWASTALTPCRTC